MRIIRACREMEIVPVALYSPIDKDGLWIRLADEAHEIESYLNVEAILNIAKAAKADAIHPGYGFLSEQSHFAKRCEEEKIIFIGPSSDAIHKAGDKIEAKQIASKQKIPVLSSSPALTSLKEAEAAAIDFPFIIKAAAGGGGRGMRIIRSNEELRRNFESARREAEASFGDGRLYLEKYIDEPRHIEIQVLADHHENAIYFPERECSIQRRYQKLIEESPSPFVDSVLRKKMGKAALSFIKAVGYTNAGTVEFIVDPKGQFYFLEMNARLQVEHPVTEAVTGIDLVKAQIEIASGKKLPWKQNQIQMNGSAIEARINCEDPFAGFIPAPGKVTELLWPQGPGVRIDSAIYSGYKIPVAFDSLIAKVIVHAKNRGESIRRMIRALSEMHIGGIASILPFHLNIFQTPDFKKGKLSTHFIEQHLSEILPPISDEEIAIAEAIAKIERQTEMILPVQQNRWAIAGRLENLQNENRN